MMQNAAERCWNKDGRVLNATDAAQCVAEYRATYSPSRFRSLMALAVSHGHPEECRKVFEAAIDHSDSPPARSATP